METRTVGIAAETTSTPVTMPPKSDRFLIGIVVAIVVLLVVAGISVVLLRQPVGELPAGTDMNQLLYPRLTLIREIDDYGARAISKQYQGICGVCGVAFTGREEKKYCSEPCKNRALYMRNSR